MEYELKHYYRVKYALVCARQGFLKEPPKDDFEEYAQKVIDRAYFIILKKIDELDGTNDRLLKYYKKNIEKYINCAIIKSERRWQYGLYAKVKIPLQTGKRMD
jgi:hypothetical protein